MVTDREKKRLQLMEQDAAQILEILEDELAMQHMNGNQVLFAPLDTNGVVKVATLAMRIKGLCRE